jgi:phytoene dehydrogenase-like protein
MVENGSVRGVTLVDGSEITCKVLVSDINAKTLYLKMIGEEHMHPMAARGMKSYDYSISVPMVYVGLDYEPPLDAHHSIIAQSPEEVNRQYFDYIKPGKLAHKNFGLVCWSTHTDPSLAPKGRHILNIIPEGGYHLQGTTWDEEKPAFIERTINNLSKVCIPGLKEHVVISDCASPLDFERRLLLPEGAIYCLQQDLPAQAVFRPAVKSRSVRGLYLTGSSTHPGGGVPSTIASGMIASKIIAQNE